MSKTVTVDLDQLVVGRITGFPIYDAKGVLLLSAGSVITFRQKQRIRERGISHVVIDEADVARTTMMQNPAASGRRGKRLKARLESLLGSGMFGISNSGPAVRKSLVQHGCNKYDPETREDLIRQQQSNSASVDQMMHEAVRGRNIDGGQVNDLAVTQIKNLTADLENTLTAAFDASDDPNLAEHSVKVALLGMAIGIELGLDADNVRLIGTCGLVQDWGMAQVPRKVREADRPLTPVEFLEIQKHPMQTVRLLERTNGIPNLVQVVAYQIHERPDGSGYPHGREKTSIHLFARILHVADAYTAMTSPRPHRPPHLPYAAMEILLRQAQQNQVDPDVVRSLLHVLSLFPIGSFVELSDGSTAHVLRSNGENYTRPVVLRTLNEHGGTIDSEDETALIDLSKSDLGVVRAVPPPEPEKALAGAHPPAQEPFKSATS